MVPVRDAVPEPLAPRLRRGISSLVGRVVMLFGLWTAMLLAFVAALQALSLGTSITGAGLLQWMIGAVLCAGILRLGVKLTRGDRNLVLFLRKFGNRRAITAANRAVASAMRRRWRLITLDDSEIEPIGVPEIRHWVITVLTVFAIVLMLSASTAALAAPADYLDTYFGPEGGGLLPAYVLMALIQLAFTEGNRAFAARAANSGKATKLNDPSQLDTITDRVQTLSGRVIAPPLMVVTVDERIWQDAVLRFADASTTVLIDISEPTENLLWEIKTLRPVLRGRWAFMCEERHFRPAPSDEEAFDSRARLEEILAGEDVLLYATSDRSQLRRFSRALQRKLETASPDRG